MSGITIFDDIKAAVKDSNVEIEKYPYILIAKISLNFTLNLFQAYYKRFSEIQTQFL